MVKKLLIPVTQKLLLGLQETYKTDRAIANYLKITRQYVYFLRKKLDVPLIKVSTVNINRNKMIHSAFMRGMSKEEIAKNENLSYQTVCRIIHKLKLEV